MFTAKVGHRHTAFRLSGDQKDLELAISGQLHSKSLRYLAEQTLRMKPFNFEGITHQRRSETRNGLR